MSYLVESGLLAQHTAGDQARPFSADDWSSYMGDALVSVVGDNLRVYPNPSVDGNGTPLIYQGIPARSKALVFVRGRIGNLAGGAQNNYLTHGAAGHASAIDLLIENRYYHPETGTAYSGVTELAPGFTVIQQQAVTKDGGWRAINLFLDGDTVQGRDFLAGVTQGGTAPNRTSGQVGIAMKERFDYGSYLEFSDFYVCSDRYVTLAGLPAAAVVRVLDSGGSEVLTGNADGNGDLVLDLLEVEELGDLATLEVDGTPVSPALGIWGGDVYDFSPTPPSQPTITVSSVTGVSADLSGSAYSDPAGDAHASSRWQVQEAGGDWSTPVYDSGWTGAYLTEIGVADLSLRTDYQARVAYQDDTGQESLWSTPVSFTTLVAISCPVPGPTDFSLCPAPDSAEGAPTGPWALYLMNDEVGSGVMLDWSGNERHGTYNDLTKVTQGVDGGPEVANRTVIRLDGTADETFPVRMVGMNPGGDDPIGVTEPVIYASLPSYAAQQGVEPSAFTVAFWVRTSQAIGFNVDKRYLTEANKDPVLAHPRHGNSEIEDRHWYAGLGICVGNAGISTWGWAHVFVDQESYVKLTPYSGWRHYVVVVDSTVVQSTERIRPIIYVDGVLASAHPDTVEAVMSDMWQPSGGVLGTELWTRVATFYQTLFGATVPSLTALTPFAGDVSEFTIWDRALTEEEIALVHETGVYRDTAFEACPDPAATAFTASG